MVSAQAKNPTAPTSGWRWISTPKVQAQQAISSARRRSTRRRARSWTSSRQGSCAQYHANAPLAYFKQIHFWKTPIADCGNGKKDCMDYTKWQQAWTQLKG